LVEKGPYHRKGGIRNNKADVEVLALTEKLLELVRFSEIGGCELALDPVVSLELVRELLEGREIPSDEEDIQSGAGKLASELGTDPVRATCYESPRTILLS
jgi:hypothetical protein